MLTKKKISTKYSLCFFAYCWFEFIFIKCFDRLICDWFIPMTNFGNSLNFFSINISIFFGKKRSSIFKSIYFLLFVIYYLLYYFLLCRFCFCFCFFFFFQKKKYTNLWNFRFHWKWSLKLKQVDLHLKTISNGKDKQYPFSLVLDDDMQLLFSDRKIN